MSIPKFLSGSDPLFATPTGDFACPSLKNRHPKTLRKWKIASQNRRMGQVFRGRKSRESTFGFGQRFGLGQHLVLARLWRVFFSLIKSARRQTFFAHTHTHTTHVRCERTKQDREPGVEGRSNSDHASLTPPPATSTRSHGGHGWRRGHSGVSSHTSPSRARRAWPRDRERRAASSPDRRTACGVETAQANALGEGEDGAHVLRAPRFGV